MSGRLLAKDGRNLGNDLILAGGAYRFRSPDNRFMAYAAFPATTISQLPPDLCRAGDVDEPAPSFPVAHRCSSVSYRRDGSSWRTPRLSQPQGQLRRSPKSYAYAVGCSS